MNVFCPKIVIYKSVCPLRAALSIMRQNKNIQEDRKNNDWGQWCLLKEGGHFPALAPFSLLQSNKNTSDLFSYSITSYPFLSRLLVPHTSVLDTTVSF